MTSDVFSPGSYRLSVIQMGVLPLLHSSLELIHDSLSVLIAIRPHSLALLEPSLCLSIAHALLCNHHPCLATPQALIHFPISNLVHHLENLTKRSVLRKRGLYRRPAALLGTVARC